MNWIRACFTLLLLAVMTRAAQESIELADLDGKRHTPLVVEAGSKGVALVFVSPFCPTSNAFTPEVNRIAAEYGDRFAFYLVEADANIQLADAKKHAETLEIKTPVLLDPAQKLVRRVQAKITPEVAVLAPNGTILYQGRVNDLYATPTKKLKEPATHDLRAALDAVAAGQPVAVPTTKAVGCSISLAP